MGNTLKKTRENIGQVSTEGIHLIVSGFAGASIGFAIQFDGWRQAGATLAAIAVTILLVELLRLLMGDTKLEAIKEATREAAYEGTKEALKESESELLKLSSKDGSPTYAED